ncbi:hypothetical protein AMC78_CH02894 [Rhizobium phaseoli]|nr:hypothetical protein AMC78_CH02894 [Rhizobium phaseoli]
MGRNSKRNREKMLRDALEAQRVENLRHPKERLLPVEFIEELRRNGLSVGDFPSFMSTHVYPSGYLVILPEASGGNSLFDEGAYYLDDESDEKTYMPSLTLWGETGNWNISVWAWTPGPGPGDFTKKLTSLDDVLENILSYFFNPNDEHFKEADLARHEMRRRSRL